MRESAKTGVRTKKWTGRGEGRREGEKKEGTTDNPLFKNLRGRCRPHYFDWSVLAFPSSGHYMLASRVSRAWPVRLSVMAACNSQKILKLKPEQKSAFEARTCSVFFQRVSAKAKYILVLYKNLIIAQQFSCHLTIEEHCDRPSGWNLQTPSRWKMLVSLSNGF